MGHTPRLRRATCAPKLCLSSKPPNDIEKTSPAASGNERRWPNCQRPERPPPGSVGQQQEQPDSVDPPSDLQTIPTSFPDISSLNLQCDQPYSSPDCTAPPRPQSPAGYPDADPFVSSGPSSLRTNDRSYVQPRTPPLTAIATLQHRRTTRSSRPASPRFNMPTRLPRLRMTPAIGHPSSGRMIRAHQSFTRDRNPRSS
jgi:hypothetical protein